MIPKLRNLNAVDASRERIGAKQRLLTEAVRLHEDAQGFAIDDPQADALARNADGDLEHRIVVRASALPISTALSASLQQLRGVFRAIVVIGLVLAIVAGATAAQMALSSPSEGYTVNFFWVLGSLLGVPTVALLLWLVLALLTPRAAAAGSLGNISFLLGRRIGQWLHKGPMQMAALQALGAMYTRTDIGRWNLSAISHALWLAFLLGCLVLVLLILSTKQYTFIWETTILSERAYITLTEIIASIPETLGFPIPDADQIAVSHWSEQSKPAATSREAWSGLLVGSIVAYGVLPRMLLLGLCLLAQKRAETQFRLDTEQPGYARLQTRLMPASRSIGVVDPDLHRDTSEISGKSHDHSVRWPVDHTSPAAIIGFEINQPKSAWPPTIRGVNWLDLGFVDSREDRRRVLERLQSASAPLRSITIVCSAATTPDRGIRGFIARVQSSASVPVLILLTDGQRLRDRGHPDEVQQRFADWRKLAGEARVPDDRVVDLDLDHLTDVSRDRVAALMGGSANVPRKRHIEQSFSLILEHVTGWSGAPDANAQAELHRAIATLYKNEPQDWRSLLRTRVDTSGDLADQLKSGASRMIELLPERLRRNPKWYGAGALAGAMGCVTAATLATPAAIATLPMWAGLGAALSLLIKPKDTETPTPESAQIDLGDAVNGAALFAILLELQGRDEDQITRIFDCIAGNEEPPLIRNTDVARQWLDTLRHRFELAEAAEGLT